MFHVKSVWQKECQISKLCICNSLPWTSSNLPSNDPQTGTRWLFVWSSCRIFHVSEIFVKSAVVLSSLHTYWLPLLWTLPISKTTKPIIHKPEKVKEINVNQILKHNSWLLTQCWRYDCYARTKITIRSLKNLHNYNFWGFSFDFT